MLVVKPGALEVIQGDAGQARQRQGVDRELLNGFDFPGGRFGLPVVMEQLCNMLHNCSNS
jgi:hypothetical protein